MRLFIVVLILIFSLQSWTMADDKIEDFEIEGISIGDSLLDFMTIQEIKKNEIEYFKDKRNYFVVGLNDGLNQYDSLELYIKSDDKNYEIKTIGAFIILDELNECLKIQKRIDQEFKDIFSNLVIYSAIQKHVYDKSGKSKQHQTNYIFGKNSNEDDHIRTECLEWSKEIKKKEGWTDNLVVVAMTKEILIWVNSGYK
tara:strand:+ start:1335 stop:1928 length:594 start_codon:yes stop_codon:yes gene_type:complete